MAHAALAIGTVSGALNFAANRENGGIWSNFDPSMTTQELEARPVDIRDARRLAVPPSLDREGFELHRLPVDNPAWTDPQWIAERYVPLSVELVRRLTGAPFVVAFHGGMVLIRGSENRDHAPPAEFVHLDQSRESAVSYIEQAAGAETLARYPHAKVFNVWRPITPPPQDVPLALCDQRTLDEADWVEGRTVEPGYPQGAPYLTSVHNPQQRWYYFPDLTPDDVVVFKGLDSDPQAPMGCLHGAFKLQLPDACPRASIEFRVLALFDE